MEEENELIDQEEIFDPESLLLNSEEETEEEEEELTELDRLLASSDFTLREKNKPLIPVNEVVRDNIQFREPPVINTKIGEIREPVNYNTTEEGVMFKPDDPKNTSFYKQTEEAKQKIEEAIANPVYTDEYVISVGEFNLFQDMDRDYFRKIDVEATRDKINFAEINYTPDIVRYNPEYKTAIEMGAIPENQKIGGFLDKPSIGFEFLQKPRWNVSQDEEYDTTKYFVATDDVKDYITEVIYKRMFNESVGNY